MITEALTGKYAWALAIHVEFISRLLLPCDRFL